MSPQPPTRTEQSISTQQPTTDDALRQQVLSLPQLIRDTTWEIENEARHALGTPDLLNLRLAVLTGSGDSYLTARAAQFAWQALGGVPDLRRRRDDRVPLPRAPHHGWSTVATARRRGLELW